MKRIVWMMILFITVVVSVIAIRVTRVAYISDFTCNVPTVSDADFLDVSDVRRLQLFGDDDSEEQLKDLVKNMIESSYSDINSQNTYQEIVDNDVYMRLNPKYHVDAKICLDDVEVGCFVHENKAIVYWSKDCRYNSKEDIVTCKINTKHLPYDRLYFEKIDGEWKAVDLFQPA